MKLNIIVGKLQYKLGTKLDNQFYFYKTGEPIDYIMEIRRCFPSGLNGDFSFNSNVVFRGTLSVPE